MNLSKLQQLIRDQRPVLAARRFAGRHTLGVHLASIGEVQFMHNVLLEYSARHPEDLIYVFHREDSVADFARRYPDLDRCVTHLSERELSKDWVSGLDLFITTEQFTPGPPGVYTVCLFHGQPAKGVTFQLHDTNVLEQNDALFLYGPLQRQTLEEHLRIWNVAFPPHLALFDVGYTKSDDLIAGRFDREAVLRELGLDPTKKTVLYAPAFNAGASLRESGIAILETLCRLEQYNVIAKLAIDCLAPTTNDYATGGVDWPKLIAQLEQRYPNFRLEQRLEADPVLACSDVTITCVSSIGFESLAIGRPVIYVDTPKFFAETLRAFFPGHDLRSWADRTAVNGGREFGLVVAGPEQLPAAIDEVLSSPEVYPRRREVLPDYLVYNPGRATPVAVDQIEALLAQAVRSRRPGDQGRAYWRMVSGTRPPLPVRAYRRVSSAVTSRSKRALTSFLNTRGYTIVRSGSGFIDAKTTIEAARRSGLSICDYREREETDQRKRGRRDRIIEEMRRAGVFEGAKSICEIGPGTGQYLERAIELATPASYEIYETDTGWRSYLEEAYGARGSTRLIAHSADGRSLQQTSSSSCELVHAHGVFVYLPFLQTFEYLREAVRVCRPGGFIVFDCYVEKSFPLQTVEAWIAGPYRFPVVISEALLGQFAEENALTTHHRFTTLHGDGTCEYFVWRKAASV